ncbi:MAG: zinc ABC transporter substrate-binding protein [Chloroflexi bacterium]|nr:zinc ABC transporter substrate-binding protein [Chloroflexota bacterium]
MTYGRHAIVVTTIYPMYHFTSVVGGESVDVRSVVTPGAEAHSFEPTPGVIRLLADADLVVANGLDLEPWLDRALDALGDDRPGLVIEASDPAVGQEGAEHDDGHRAEHDDGHRAEHDDGHLVDPHVWLDPVLAIGQVGRIRDALVQVDPSDAAGYEARADAFVRELDDLNEAFATRLSDCRHRHFVTTHAAYGYLAERYGLEQIAIAGLSPDAEPSARDLAELTERVTSLGLRYVLAEPSLSLRLAETVASESGLTLLPVHLLESVTDAELAEHGDYLGLMRDNLESLATALECAA